MTLREVVHRKYTQRHRDLLEALLNGVKGWDEYQFVRGQLTGLHNLIEDIDGYLKDPESAFDEVAEGRR